MPASAAVAHLRLRPLQARHRTVRLQAQLGLRRPTPLHYEYALLKRDAVPQNNPANPKYRALIAAWQRLPRARRQRPRTAHRPSPGVNAWSRCCSCRTAFRSRRTRATRSARTTCCATWRSATRCTSARSSTSRPTAPTSLRWKHCARARSRSTWRRRWPGSARLTGLLRGEALTVPYYRAPALQRWVDATIDAARHHEVCRVLLGRGPVRRATIRS